MDSFIDHDETQTYGPALRANLTRSFADAAEPVATIVRWVIEGQKAADEAIATAMHKARHTGSGSSAAANEKAPAAVAARKLMIGFQKHLDSKTELGTWTGDIALFFPGGRTGVSKYAGPLLVSIEVTMKALADDETVPDHAWFTAKLKKTHKELAQLITDSGDANHNARGGLSEQSAEKVAWLREYRSNVQIIAGILQKAQRSDELNAMIPHLSAPGGQKSSDEAASNTDTAPIAPVTPNAVAAPVAPNTNR